MHWNDASVGRLTGTTATYFGHGRHSVSSFNRVHGGLRVLRQITRRNKHTAKTNTRMKREKKSLLRAGLLRGLEIVVAAAYEYKTLFHVTDRLSTGSAAI